VKAPQCYVILHCLSCFLLVTVFLSCFLYLFPFLSNYSSPLNPRVCCGQWGLTRRVILTGRWWPTRRNPHCLLPGLGSNSLNNEEDTPFCLQLQLFPTCRCGTTVSSIVRYVSLPPAITSHTVLLTSDGSISSFHFAGHVSVKKCNTHILENL
jgi:hypothetical protein